MKNNILNFICRPVTGKFGPIAKRNAAFWIDSELFLTEK